MELINFSKANCRSCYKCLRSCPVKAIRIKNDQAKIDEKRCVTCGQCLKVCPQNARKIKSDIYKIKNAIKSNRTVLAIVAPSFAGAFELKFPGQLAASLKILGFDKVLEVALGAQLVTKLYNDYVNENHNENYITTSCPSINHLIQTYYPSLINYLIPVDSPMIALGKILKRNFDNCFITFIGPCYSKKFESVEDDTIGIIDAVLTFDELSKWLDENSIVLNELEPVSFDDEADYTGRLFPVPGKLDIAFKNNADFNYDYISADGIDRCIELFKSIEDGNLNKVFIEALACRGGCINGPAMPKNDTDYFVRQRNIIKYIKTNTSNLKAACLENINDIDFCKTFKDKSLNKTLYNEEEIKQVLRKMGKNSPLDELNCGVCGYNTCREKAQAVLDGMAEINMCIHYIRNKAESITNVVFETSPNAIFTLDEDFLIKDFNPASEKMFNIKYEDIKDKPVCMIMDDNDFYKVKNTKENIIGRKVSLSEYDLVVLENIIYLQNHGVFLVIINDITMQEKSKGELARVKEKTIDAAQAVIEKQMRVAQEIASLLGETTAETKVILTKLKAIALGEVNDNK
ncbi:4Fe-4S binding protein [Clostridium sp. SYSU_GA19001]|uniref:[Fe-Fe] hydrogenase large subunit C-terminal domain-containing protein n=1 Tax=Clostridium caldaquaticum TaxID=2940653 RepID=UPI002077554F|nr:[Fe-Fe] hydrogenase large subunit C-terminal domain-containing protein [Clostridium caldaquaticum]MCM8712142.1 4Fe-4S binding protein [Clostridium caldaquaticum]